MPKARLKLNLLPLEAEALRRTVVEGLASLPTHSPGTYSQEEFHESESLAEDIFPGSSQEAKDARGYRDYLSALGEGRVDPPPEEDEWTRVEDRLPEDGTYVLVGVADVVPSIRKAEVVVCYYNDHEWRSLRAGGLLLRGRPLVWRNLPELPDLGSCFEEAPTKEEARKKDGGTEQPEERAQRIERLTERGLMSAFQGLEEDDETGG